MGKVNTEPGYRNHTGQVVVRGTDLPGADQHQYVSVVRRGNCAHEYGANRSDVFQRKCPNC